MLLPSIPSIPRTTWEPGFPRPAVHNEDKASAKHARCKSNVISGLIIMTAFDYYILNEHPLADVKHITG